MDNLNKFSAAMANSVRMENNSESHEDLDRMSEMTVRELCEMLLFELPKEALDSKVGNLFEMLGIATDYEDFGRMIDEMG